MRNRDARIYQTDDRIIGCSLGTGRRTLVGHPFRDIEFSAAPNQGITRLRLSGPFAAQVFVDEREGSRLPQLYVNDLRTGRETTEVFGTGQYTDFTDLEVTPQGSVVFVEADQGAPNADAPSNAVVHRNDARGRTVIDASRMAEPHSLTLRNGVASWLSGSARLRADVRD